MSELTSTDLQIAAFKVKLRLVGVDPDSAAGQRELEWFTEALTQHDREEYDAYQEYAERRLRHLEDWHKLIEEHLLRLGG